jgi:Protein of unknown function (DUF1353)
MRATLLAVLVLLMVGCQTIPSPSVSQFADGSHWVLEKPLRYRLKETNETIEVPRGFVTDFASIPRVAWSVMAPTDRPGRAGIIHDWLYWDQGCSREQADKIMLLGMEETGVNRVKRSLIYRALRLAGGFAWNDNAKTRASGLPRQIEDADLPLPADAVWPTFQQQLYSKGQRATANPADRKAPTYCSVPDTLSSDEPSDRRPWWRFW